MIQMKKTGGKQRDWASIKKTSKQPVITIITSTFNAAQDLPWTICSVKEQKYPNIQWIVADGASTDNTIQLLEENNNLIDYWFSAEDKGIYDAWNKALSYIQGEWVQFIGAGDEWYTTDTLTKVVAYLRDAYPTYNLVYGRVMYVSENDRKELGTEGESWQAMQDKWVSMSPKLPTHSVVFHHSSILKGKQVFDTRFKIVADWHFLRYHALLKPFLFVPLIINKMPLGGVSGKLESHFTIAKENRLSSIELGYKIPVRHIVSQYCKIYAKKILLFFLPRVLVLKIVDFYKKIRGDFKVWTVE